MRFFDDFAVGEQFVSRGVTISEAAILDFALKYDPQRFHLDAEAAKETPYGGLIASGFQTLALAFRMFLQLGDFDHASVGSPGMDELRWLAPVRPGDTLRTFAEILEKTPSRSKPDRGSLVVAFRVLTQRDETVMTFRTTVILLRRPATAPTPGSGAPAGT
jgi:acyl dehydratase